MYSIHESTLDFVITISINATAPPPGLLTAAFKASDVLLTPSYPKRRSSDGQVAAQLAGDLMPYNAFPVLTSQLLLMPSLAGVSTLRPSEWMLLEPSMVTMDGSECNKVGVGFSAFRCAQCCQAALGCTCTHVSVCGLVHPEFTCAGRRQVQCSLFVGNAFWMEYPTTRHTLWPCQVPLLICLCNRCGGSLVCCGRSLWHRAIGNET